MSENKKSYVELGSHSCQHPHVQQQCYLEIVYISRLQHFMHGEYNTFDVHQFDGVWPKVPMINVLKTYDTGKIWVFDNEFSTYEGYKYFYHPTFTKWYWIQEWILKSLCIFNKKMIINVQNLAEKKSPVDFLMDFLKESEPLYQEFEDKIFVPEVHRLCFTSRFAERLNSVLLWVEHCKRK